MSFSLFLPAFDTRLQTLAFDQKAIAWTNVTFQPTKGRPYLTPRMTGVNRQPQGFGRDTPQRWTGFYQVGVNWPRDTGSSDLGATIDRILALFPRGLSLPIAPYQAITVERSTAQAAVPFGDWSMVPVLAEWFCTEQPGS